MIVNHLQGTKRQEKNVYFFFLNEAYMLSIRHFDLSKTLLTKKDLCIPKTHQNVCQKIKKNKEYDHLVVFFVLYFFFAW